MIKIKTLFIKSSLWLSVACAMLLGQGCYHYRVSSANFDPSTNYQKKTVHSFFWGAAQKRTNGVDVVTSNCDSLRINKIDEVRITNNFLYALATVGTLGIWCPIQIEWKCPKPCTQEGTIP
jgi:Bor protein